MTSNKPTFSIPATLAAAFALLLPLVAAPAPAAAGEPMALPANFQANVMMVGGATGGAASTMLEIRLREWTTEEERQQILGEIQEASAQGGRIRNRAAARALRGSSQVGSMNIRAQTGWPIRYSRLVMLPDGTQRILLATDRPVTFAEALGNPVVGDFDVTLLELTFDAEGSGSGVLSVGTEVRWNSETESLEVTNFSSQPIRLSSVRRVK